MDNALGHIFSVASAAWAFVCINAVALFKMWPAIMARINERKRDAHVEKSSDWQRLRDEIKRLDARIDALLGRCDELQHEVDACRQREHEWMRRAIAAEAFQLGQGEARQDAANIVAVERIVDPNKHKGPEGGGK